MSSKKDTLIALFPLRQRKVVGTIFAVVKSNFGVYYRKDKKQSMNSTCLNFYYYFSYYILLNPNDDNKLLENFHNHTQTALENEVNSYAGNSKFEGN